MAKEEDASVNSDSVVSKLLFLKSLRLFQKGHKKDISVSVLTKQWPYHKSRKLGEMLEKEWDRMGDDASVSRMLWKCFGATFLFYGFLQALVDISIVILAQPYLVGKIVSFFAPDQKTLTKNDALFHVFVLIFLLAFKVFFDSNVGLVMAALSIKVRTALCSLLYRKILKRSRSDLSEGNTLTLITKDIQALEMFVPVGNMLWICIVKLLVISVLLFLRVGLSSFVGIGCFLFWMPLQVFLGGKVRGMKMQMLKETDERLQLIRETVSAIRLIKMYAWERFFAARIHACRKKEMTATLKLFLVRFSILTIGSMNAHLAFYFTLMVYVKLGHNISAEKIYFIVFIFKSLMVIFALDFPDAINKTSEAVAATKRFEFSLKQMELTRLITNDAVKNPVVSASNVTVAIQDKPLLRNVTINIDKGLTIISGRVGSGKSIFLKTLLGDYAPKEGILTVQGSTSYASQEPWLFPSTIRDNILFGLEHDAKRYQEVLRVCALSYDLELLKFGDSTVVEDRGANLSKGQQARVNLARAVYKESDIYLLDDPLAALDSNVAATVFENCLKRFLADKIVILVTHNLSFAREADKVVFFEDGMVVDRELEEDNSPDRAPTTQEQPDEDVDETTALMGPQKTYQEQQKSGKVEMKTYISYAKFGGGLIAAVLVFSTQGLVAGVLNYGDLFISDWVNAEEQLLSSNLTTQNELEQKHQDVFFTYNILMLLTFLILTVRSAGVLVFARRASINIHKKMMHSVIGAAVEFFDSNFLGSILNRFSKDLTGVDELIPFSLLGVVRGVCLVGGTGVVIGLINPWLLVLVGVLLCLTVWWRKFTVRTSTGLQRLETMTRSPFVGHINATLEGLTTVRAFQAEDTVKKEFDCRLDIHACSSYSFQSCSKAYIFVLEAVNALFNSLIILRFFVIDDGMEAGYVGLAVYYGFMITTGFNMAVSDLFQIENHMTFTERVLEYTEISQEKSQLTEIQDWPTTGGIGFQNVSLKYSNENILNNVDFQVAPGEKIGIVGRTGAGKSSLISALFRLYNIEGKILIDGVDIKTVSRSSLRSSISIIPQEPVVFSGTVRDNLDPFRKHTDEELWSVAEKVDLKKHIGSLDDQLGSNSFSLGQKQLLCIARAVLRKNKIVVLDEATASTDEETERSIYRAVEEHFSDCTVLTIAHKLRTVLESDRIVVLEKGAMVEIGTPEELLRNGHGAFYGMAEAAGLTQN